MLFNNSEMIPSRYIAESITAGLFGPVALCSCVQNSCLSRGSEECCSQKSKQLCMQLTKVYKAKMSCNQVVIASATYLLKINSHLS